MPRLQDVILRGTAASRPLATAVSVGTLYYSTDTATTDRSNGTVWETYADSSGGAASSSVARLAAPFVAEPEEHYYEPQFPGAGGSGGSGTIGPPGPQGSAGTVASPAYPFFPDIQEVIEPVIPIPGPVGPAGSVGSITTAQKTRQIGITVDGGASVLTTGLKGFKSFPVAGTIVGVRLLADQSGSIVMDIWKDTYANFPPVVGDTITASAKPTITTAQKSEDVTLTGWTTSVAAGDVFAFNIDSVSSIKRITLELTIVVT